MDPLALGGDNNTVPRGLSVGRYVSVGPEISYYNADHSLRHASLHPLWYEPRAGFVALVAN